MKAAEAPVVPTRSDVAGSSSLAGSFSAQLPTELKVGQLVTCAVTEVAANWIPRKAIPATTFAAVIHPKRTAAQTFPRSDPKTEQVIPAICPLFYCPLFPTYPWQWTGRQRSCLIG